VYACDHFVTPEHCLGSIETSDLSTLVDMPAQRSFGSNKRTGLPSQCHSCSWLSVCNGGCPKDRFAQTENGEHGLNYLCDGFRQFFAHAEQPLKQVMRLGKQGLSPEAIMAKLHAVAQDRWRGIGRNDLCPCGSGKKAKQCCWSKKP